MDEPILEQLVEPGITLREAIRTWVEEAAAIALAPYCPYCHEGMVRGDCWDREDGLQVVWRVFWLCGCKPEEEPVSDLAMGYEADEPMNAARAAASRG